MQAPCMHSQHKRGYMLLVSCQGTPGHTLSSHWQRRYEAPHMKLNLLSIKVQKDLTQQRLLRGVAWLIRSRGLVQVLGSQPQTRASSRALVSLYVVRKDGILHVKPEASF
jgi:hypothetical protein